MWWIKIISTVVCPESRMEETNISNQHHADFEREMVEGPISHLPSVLLLHVFSFLGSKQLAAAACVQKSWKLLAAEDDLWQPLVARDWLPHTSPRTPDGIPLPTFQVMYTSYHTDFSKYEHLFGRAKQCWQGLRTWLSHHMPDIEASLAPGATEAELDDVESVLNVQLPPAMRVLYRLCNGQILKYDRQLDTTRQADADPSAFHGLFGGYSFYDHNVNVRLLPLQRIKEWTSRVLPHFTLPNSTQRIVVAASFNLLKLVFLDCSNGLIYVGTRDVMSGGGEMLPAVPPGAACADRRFQRTRLDGMLRWMEEYSRRLHEGKYLVRNLNDWEFSRGICLFPESGLEVTQAVTQGVQIRCSAVFVPEVCSLASGTGDRHFFSYSVRMQLLAASGDFSSCQLRARHWLIRDEEEVVDEVRGEAVIGKYPLLHEGGGEFAYQSCCSLQGNFGSIEGDFRFVPGSMRSPEGPEFNARVARFPMIVPEYIF